MKEIKFKSNPKEFFYRMSERSKLELDKKKTFFQFRERGKISTFYAFTKTGINAINAESGTGKSLLLNEILLYLVHTGQIERVIWIDLDDNNSTLDSRNEAYFIKPDKDFILLTNETIIEDSKDELSYICADIRELENEMTAEQLESGFYADKYKELKDQAKKLSELINRFDFLALLEYVLLSDRSFFELDNSAIVLDSVRDTFDTGKIEIIQPIFFNILRPLTKKGATLFYLNHITKGDGTGKRNYAGSHLLKGKTDYFTIISRPIKNQDLLNVEPAKDRHGNGANFAFTYDLNAPMGERLFKCDYLDSVEGFTDAQNDTMANIIKALSTGDKTASELEKVCGRVSDGANKQAFFKISQTTEFKEKIAKKQVGKNVFYSLKTKAPAIYEPIDD